MGCRAIHRSWTVCSLVGAFLDLAVAYFLLCGAAVAFISSKSLSLFGLSLPCPCCGFFGRPRGAACLHRLLVAYPTDQITAVNAAARTRFPFDSFWIDDSSCGIHSDLRTSERRVEEESCGSASSLRDSTLSVDRRIERDGRNLKGKGEIFEPKPKVLVRRRDRHRRDCECRTTHAERKAFEASSMAKQSVCSLAIVDSDEVSSPPGTQSKAAALNVKNHAHEELANDVIANLERALERERNANAALNVELEKERNATATAVDEAMAMILRLQEEKAAFEMEARHYQRIVEEKSAYDDEEMAILKEIIFRREREKHMLEKEVESYRCMLLSGGTSKSQLDGYLHNKFRLLAKDSSVSDLYDIQLPVEHKLSDSADKENDQKEEGSYSFKGKGQPVAADINSTSFLYKSLADQLEITKRSFEQCNFDDESNIEFQEKTVVVVDSYPSSRREQRSEFDILSGSNVDAQNDGQSNIELTVDFSVNGEDSDYGAEQRNLHSPMLVVHAIGDKHDSNSPKFAVGINNKGCTSPRSSTTSVNANGFSAANLAEVEQSIHRSCSEVMEDIRVKDYSVEKSSFADVRRNSMPAADTARLILESEVEMLRRRLKMVQEGRQKLSSSLEQKEKGGLQLRSSNEILSQHLETAGVRLQKIVRDSSLPPLSLKANPKKRRCHSVPLELNESK